MSNTIILVLLAVVALVVIVFLSARKPGAKIDFWKQSTKGDSTDELSSSDFRSKKIKCQRCGAPAYGVLGTENIYRYQSCGFKTKDFSDTRHN